MKRRTGSKAEQKTAKKAGQGVNILFISMSPIHRGVNIGNTFLNVLDGISGITFSGVYTKNGAPGKELQNAFRLNEKMILKKALHKSNTVGEVVEARSDGAVAETDKLVAFAKKKRFTAFFWAQAMVWALPYWKSGALNDFLDAVQPDVLFTLLSDSVVLNKLIAYIQDYTKKPLVVYAWDNNYTLKMGAVSPLRRLNRHINRIYMRKTVRRAAQMYVISDVQKRDYEKEFGVPCKVLTKSSDFSGEPPLKTQYDSPLQLVFTGNIGTNRWKSLAMIAEALESINQNGVRAQLRIYTATPLTQKMENALRKKDASFIMGSVPASEIPRIQSEADMLVHVESFDRKARLQVRQSFSTKLVDYFRVARPILAVGPRDVASIEHLIRNDCALTASSAEEVRQALLSVLGGPDKLNDLSKKAYACGRRNHDAAAMHGMLQADLEKLVKEP